MSAMKIILPVISVALDQYPLPILEHFQIDAFTIKDNCSDKASYPINFFSTACPLTAMSAPPQRDTAALSLVLVSRLCRSKKILYREGNKNAQRHIPNLVFDKM